jgi:transcription elongation factor GreA
MEPTQAVSRGATRSAAPSTVPPGAAARRVPLTADECERYTRELLELRERRAQDVPDQLRQVRGLVTEDAVEELAQIQNSPATVELRIARLEDLLLDCEIVPEDRGGNVVSVGCTVGVEYVRTGRSAQFHLVGLGAPVTSRARYVSARSPVGQAVLGCVVGDVVTVALPTGAEEVLRIASIRHDDDV